MQVVVKKFGGTSVANQECLDRVAKTVIETVAEGLSVVVVVSAPGKMTDELVSRYREISSHPARRELDLLLSVGERVSIALLAMTLEAMGQPAVALTGAQAGIITNPDHGHARITEIHASRMMAELLAGKVVVVAGFQGITATGEETTLGRGGSDTTAVALAAALGALRCEIWTDVDGIYEAHPGLVPEAARMKDVNYATMMELAENGAQVLKASAVEMAMRHGVALHVGSSFTQDLGSCVHGCPMDEKRVTGVCLEESIVVFSLKNTNSSQNFSLIHRLAREGVAVRSIWERGSECGLIIDQDHLAEALLIVDACYGDHAELELKRHLSLLSVIGAGVNFGSDIMARVLDIFQTLELHPEHYFCSEMRVSFAVNSDDAKKALVQIHEALLRDTQELSVALI